MPTTKGVFEGDLMYLTDGGLETTLIFHEDTMLPHFASFTLLESASGRQQLARYYRSYLDLYRKFNCGFVMETPTWRANLDWAEKLDIDTVKLDKLNQQAVNLCRELVWDNQRTDYPILISGNIGPRGDGYIADNKMTISQAEQYHTQQIKSFAKAGVDLVTAVTINYIEEAIGIVRAANRLKLPVVISFTVETDGKLPGGETLQQAIEAVDKATGSKCLHYMINCAHPSHYLQPVIRGGDWLKRIGGLRSNASVLSHVELDEAENLDEGDPREFAYLHGVFVKHMPNLRVLGGCCGTDCRHIQALASGCMQG